jgi:hypothetical protein
MTGLSRLGDEPLATGAGFRSVHLVIRYDKHRLLGTDIVRIFTALTAFKYYEGDQIKEDKMGVSRSTYVEENKYIQAFVGKN